MAKIETPPVPSVNTVSPALSLPSKTKACQAVTAAQGRVAASSNERCSGTETSPVSGRTTVSGTGYIEQQPGVHVTIPSEQQIVISGGGIRNQTSRAENLQIFGINPTLGTSTVTVSANTNFIGVIDAPEFDITISGGSAFIGAAVGRSATLIGGGGFHYDERLGALPVGAPVRYEFASWSEDVR